MRQEYSMSGPCHSSLPAITVLGTTLAAISFVFTISLMFCSWFDIPHPFAGNPGVFFLLVPFVPFSILSALCGVAGLLKSSCSLRMRMLILAVNVAGILASSLLGYWMLKLWIIGPINLS